MKFGIISMVSDQPVFQSTM